jgi:hypothetical protein
MVARQRKPPERILTLWELLLLADVSGGVGGALGASKVAGGSIGSTSVATLHGLVVGLAFATLLDRWGWHLARYVREGGPPSMLLLRFSYGVAMVCPLASGAVAALLTRALLRELGW